MTASIEPRTRRAMLGAGLGALVAGVGTALGRPNAVRDEGRAVVVGGEYTDAVSPTLIQNQSANTESVIVGKAGTRGTALVGIGGATGVAGTTSVVGGTGVYAESTDGIGLDALSGSSYAVRAQSSTNTAIHGRSVHSIGVVAMSQNDTGLVAASDFGPAFVAHAASTVGAQIINLVGTGLALEGGTTGLDVFVTTPGGHAVNSVATDGYALRSTGRIKLGTSGVATIPANATSVTVTPGVDVSAASFVLLTPKANLGGRDLWFTTNVDANTFAIRISTARTQATKISWLLLDQP